MKNNKDESEDSLLTTLANATGWLSSKVVATSFVLMQFIQPAQAVKCASEHIYKFIPVTGADQAKYYFACAAPQQPGLYQTLIDSCNVTISAPITRVLQKLYIETNYLDAVNIYNNNTGWPQCTFFSLSGMDSATKTCIKNILTNAVKEECESGEVLMNGIKYVAAAFAMIGGMALTGYFLYKIIEYIITPEEVEYGPPNRPQVKPLDQLSAEAIIKIPKHAAFFQSLSDDHPHKILVEEAKENAPKQNLLVRLLSCVE